MLNDRPVPQHLPTPRTFSLYRRHDVTGMSGEGVVADGCVFGDGTTVVRWRAEPCSTAVWPSFDAAMHVHGHHGATVAVWHDQTERAPEQLHEEPSPV